MIPCERIRSEPLCEAMPGVWARLCLKKPRRVEASPDEPMPLALTLDPRMDAL